MRFIEHCLALILLIVALLAPSFLKASLLAPTVSRIPSWKRSKRIRYLLIANPRARSQPPICRFGMES